MIICLQALNNLAVTDDNKVKIVNAGALAHYVKLLRPERDQSEQQAAAHGLWMLASNSSCRTSIVQQNGCTDGQCPAVSIIIIIISDDGRCEQWMPI